MNIALSIIQADIADVPFLILDGHHHGVYETLVGCQVQLLVTLQDFLMQFAINLHGIALHQLTGSLIVALTLDALNLCQQTGKEGAQRLIVVDAHKGLSLVLFHLDGVTLFVAPVGYQRTVAHVCLLNLVTWFDAYQLCHQTIHDIAVIL